GLVGILVPGVFSVYSFLEQLKPVLGILGLVVSIGVGVTVLILNIEKIRRVRQDRRINDIILKQPETRSTSGKQKP
ncbi:unnamed protein product, partial [marine sediment metagenome]